MKNYQQKRPFRLCCSWLGSVALIVLLNIGFATQSRAHNGDDGCGHPCINTASDECSTATLLNLGADCVYGNNFGFTANFTTDTAACDSGEWVDDGNGNIPVATAWYKFTTTTAGYYTVNTDNSSGDGSIAPLFSDTRVKVLAGGPCGGWTTVWCNDDGGDCNTLASQVTGYLAANTTYYVLIEGFGGSEVEWCINVYQNQRPVNDCITNAIDLGALICSVNTNCNPVVCESYFYNTPSFRETLTTVIGVDPDPTDTIPGDTLFIVNDDLTFDDPLSDNTNDPNDASCNNNLSIPVRNTIRGVWFCFKGDTCNKDVWLNIFPNNCCNFYVASLFEKTGPLTGVDCPNGNDADNEFGGLLWKGCSIGDGQPESGEGNGRNKSCGSNFGHPRLDLTGLIHGRTYYVRVAQYTPVLVGDPAEPVAVAPPEDGIFNLVLEATHQDNGVSSDEVSQDSCCTAINIGCLDTCANRNWSIEKHCLTTAGAKGNISAASGSTCNPAPDGCQPEALTSNGTGYWVEGCDPDRGFFGSVTKQGFSAPSIYKFCINDQATFTLTPCVILRQLVDGLQNIGFGDPLVDGPYQAALAQLETIVNTICNDPNLTVLNSELCATINSLLTTIRGLIPAPAQPVLYPVLDAIQEIVDFLCNENCNDDLCQLLDRVLADLLGINAATDLVIGQLRTAVGLLCNTVLPTVCTQANALVNTLDGTLPPQADPIVAAIRLLLSIICDPTITGTCQAQVTVTLSDIKNIGCNGHGQTWAFVYHASDTGACKLADYTPMGGATAWCDTCMEMGHQVVLNAPLLNGCYYIVVDAEDGNLLTYDLSVSVQHYDANGDSCGVACDPAPKKGQVAPVIPATTAFKLNEVRPVPATDRIEIEFISPEAQSNLTMAVFDTRGKQVYSNRINVDKGVNVQDLNISGFAKGVYLISIDNGKESVHGKFVKID